jgi:LysM repeat protein
MLEVLARIRHRRTRRQLSPYLDGVLSVQESRRLEAHLAQCRACRDELAELRATVQTLAELPLAEAPRSFALTAAPRRIEAPRPAARRLEFGLRLATVTAAFVFAVVAFGDLLGVPGGDEEEAATDVAARMEVAPTGAGIMQETLPVLEEAQPSEATAEDKALTVAPTAAAPAQGLTEGYGGGEPPAATVTEVVPQMAVPGITEPATPAATATLAATPAPAATGAPASAPALTETPPPPATVTIGPAGLVYVVQPGDTLTALSERFGLNPEAIAAANGMAEPQPLLAEQELVIPGAVYHVQPGDTLADVAAAFGVPEAVIVTANSIAAPGAIGAGQPLAIPGGGALPATPPPIGAQIAPSESEQPLTSEADERAPAEVERETFAAEDGGPSRETVVRWLEIGLATGMALLFVSWVLARRGGRA